MLNEMRVGCENCTKCFSGCKKAFPVEYLEGGAEKCKDFSNEPDPKVVYSNMDKYVSGMKDKLSDEGVFL